MISRHVLNTSTRLAAALHQGQFSSSRSLLPLSYYHSVLSSSSSSAANNDGTRCDGRGNIGRYCRRYSGTYSSDIAERTKRLLTAKSQAGLSYDDLASKLGVTNTYAAQLLLGQAKLSSAESAAKLQEALPSASAEDIEAMRTMFPMRSFDDEILKEPNVYRTYEAITHYGEAIKSIINEQCGDGIMSAIDFYCDVGTTTGKNGEKRVVITFNGKFLPHTEQKIENNTAQSPRD